VGNGDLRSGGRWMGAACRRRRWQAAPFHLWRVCATPPVPGPLRKGISCRWCFSARCVVVIVPRDFSEPGSSRYRSTGDKFRERIVFRAKTSLLNSPARNTVNTVLWRSVGGSRLGVHFSSRTCNCCDPPDVLAGFFVHLDYCYLDRAERVV
jgi:hypothetical protein